MRLQRRRPRASQQLARQKLLLKEARERQRLDLLAEVYMLWHSLSANCADAFSQSTTMSLALCCKMSGLVLTFHVDRLYIYMLVSGLASSVKGKR